MTETKLKAVTIEAVFPELKGIFAMPTGRSQGSNVRAAGANAMRDLLRQLKCKRFTTAQATISFSNVGADARNEKNVKLVNHMTMLRAEHERASPLKFMGQPKK